MAIAWYNPSWSHRQKITIASANVTAPLTGYPITIEIEANKAMISQLQSSAGDLVVTSSDGTTKIPHSIEGYENLFTKDGVRTWYTQPSSLRYGTKTYTGWCDGQSRVVVSTLDHTTGAYEEFVLATLPGGPDDHNNPALHIIQNGTHAGKLMCAYSAHRDALVRIRRATTVGSISAFETEVTHADTDVSYSHIAEFSNGTIRLYYRGPKTTEWGRKYIDSTNGGTTWSTATSMFIEGSGTGLRPYFQQFWDTNNPNRVDFICTNSGPGESTNIDVYHFYYDHSTGKYYKSDGTDLGSALPLKPTDVTKIWDDVTNGGTARCIDIKRTLSGKIGILLSVKVDANTLVWAHITMYHGFFNPSSSTWTMTEIADMGPSIMSANTGVGFSSGGGTFLHESLTEIGDIILSVVSNSRRVLKRFVSVNDGATWDLGTLFGNAISTNKQFRPSGVRNFGAAPDANLLATWCSGQYHHWANGFNCGIGVPNSSAQVARVIVTFKGDLTNLANNEFYVYWGNSSVADQQNVANTYPASKVLYEVGDRADLPMMDTLSGAGISAMTVLALGKFPATASVRHILSNWKGNVNFRLNTTGGNLQLFANDSAGVVKSINATDLGASLVNTFYHMAGAYNNPSGMSAYLDGTASAIASSSINSDINSVGISSWADPAKNGHGIWIGKTPHEFGKTSNISEWDGEIKFVGLFTEEMSAAWIATNSKMWKMLNWHALGASEALPTFVSSIPPDNAASVGESSSITAVASEDMKVGTGTIQLRQDGTLTVLDSMPAANVTINIANKTEITFGALSLIGVSGPVHLYIPDGSLLTVANTTPYVGAVNTSGWNFTVGSSNRSRDRSRSRSRY